MRWGDRPLANVLADQIKVIPGGTQERRQVKNKKHPDLTTGKAPG